MTHEIRLAGPWEFRISTSDAWVRCRLPYVAPDNLSDVETVFLRRSFHRPSGLSSETRLFLVVNGVRGLDRIQVNTGQVDATKCVNAAVEFDVSNLLDSFNQVSIELPQRRSEVDSVILRIDEIE